MSSRLVDTVVVLVDDVELDHLQQCVFGYAASDKSLR